MNQEHMKNLDTQEDLEMNQDQGKYCPCLPWRMWTSRTRATTAVRPSVGRWSEPGRSTSRSSVSPAPCPGSFLWEGLDPGNCHQGLASAQVSQWP